jgi:hypothetical protein
MNEKNKRKLDYLQDLSNINQQNIDIVILTIASVAMMPALISFYEHISHIHVGWIEIWYAMVLGGFGITIFSGLLSCRWAARGADAHAASISPKTLKAYDWRKSDKEKEAIKYYNLTRNANGFTFYAFCIILFCAIGIICSGVFLDKSKESICEQKEQQMPKNHHGRNSNNEALAGAIPNPVNLPRLKISPKK